MKRICCLRTNEDEARVRGRDEEEGGKGVKEKGIRRL
jgi:hypothetical protein